MILVQKSNNKHYNNIGPLAQWLEPPAHNRLVAGSSPAGSTTFFNLTSKSSR